MNFKTEQLLRLSDISTKLASKNHWRVSLQEFMESEDFEHVSESSRKKTTLSLRKMEVAEEELTNDLFSIMNEIFTDNTEYYLVSHYISKLQELIK